MYKLIASQVQGTKAGEGGQKLSWDVVKLVMSQTEVRQIRQDAFIFSSPPTTKTKLVSESDTFPYQRPMPCPEGHNNDISF